jgi:nucleoside-diphosphate-sugar epimerase
MKKVCVLGVNGFIGKNLMRNTDWVGVTRKELDLTNQLEVQEYFKTHKYDVVIHCAVVGGSRLRVDDGDVIYKNLLMFENVVRVFKGKLIYFSSGAALRGTPPTDPYGLSKWLIDRRIENIPNAYSLRIWGCYGPDELPSRFSAVCKNKGHIVIERDRYFDFVDVEYVKKIVHTYVIGDCTDKEFNLVYPEKLLLSQWAERFGATYEIKDISEYDEPYYFVNPYKED